MKVDILLHFKTYRIYDFNIVTFFVEEREVGIIYEKYLCAPFL